MKHKCTTDCPQRFFRGGGRLAAFPASQLVCFVLLAGAAVGQQRELLQTFRDEFVAMTPGKGQFPRTVAMGRVVPHIVTLNYDFAVAKYEVTQDLWAAVMGSNQSRWKGPRNSAEMLSRAEAEEFCRRVTTALRSAELITDDQVVRLPSEAEWEYAARAGTETLYSFGDDPQELPRYGWYRANAAGNDPPVGAKLPNPWGLYDIHGYLWEWCSDAWHETLAGAPARGEPWLADGDPSRGVLRSGSWKDPAHQLTSAARRAASKHLRDDAVGFRCVLARESAQHGE